MSKVCSQCGNIITGNDDYCVVCDKVVDTITKEAYDSMTALAAQGKKQVNITGTNADKSGLIKALGYVRQIVIIVFALVVLYAGYYYIKNVYSVTYESAVDRMEDGLNDKNMTAFEEAFFPEFSKKYKADVDMIYSRFEAHINGKVRFHVIDNKELDKYDIEALEEDIYSDLGEKPEIKKAVKFTLRIVASGNSGSSDKYEKEVYSCKTGNKWYLYYKH